MIKSLQIAESFSPDPYENLAIETCLLETLPPETCILYLWQNQNTVVIGRNQNAWAECRLGALERDGGKLARRSSGGGAVYHDLGNLNFTFLASEGDYDLSRQISVIQAACAVNGIETVLSGRNDLLANGFKFSGNAFYHSRGKAYQHGTLMVDVDKDRLTAYLTPPKAKLEAKGIQSVRSRVVNLRELCPGLTCDQLRQDMKDAFSKVYGLPATPVSVSREAVEPLQKQYGSWEYLFGQRLPATVTCQGHFPWGHIQIELAAQAGIIQSCRVYTDAMDWALSQKAESALTGCRLCREDLERALDGFPDICALLKEQIL